MQSDCNKALNEGAPREIFFYYYSLLLHPEPIYSITAIKVSSASPNRSIQCVFHLYNRKVSVEDLGFKTFIFQGTGLTRHIDAYTLLQGDITSLYIPDYTR